MKVGLFIPCYIDAFFPEVGVATLELLEAARLFGRVPARSNLLRAADGQQRLPGRCGRHRSPLRPLFPGIRYHRRAVGQLRPPHPLPPRRGRTDAAEARKVRQATRELIEFLHDDLKVEAFPWAAFPHKVGLHDSCSAVRGLGHARPSELVNEPYFSKTRDLLGKVQGLELVEIDRPDECCGFGGSFCVTDEAVSAKMGYDRVHDFHRHGAEYIASADMSCLLHMKGVIDRLKLPLKVIHVAQILNGGPFDQESGIRSQESGVRSQ